MLAVELAIVFFLILLNGLLAMSELAIVSSRPARLRPWSNGSRRARGARWRWPPTPGRFLSTVQIGITLVGVLSGAFSGATLGLRLTEWLVGVGMPAGVADVIGIGVVVAVITYLSLIVGELVPKQIALAQSGSGCRAGRAGDDAAREDIVAAGLAAGCVGHVRCCGMLGQREHDGRQGHRGRDPNNGRRGRERRRARARREGDDRRRDAARRRAGRAR